MENLKESGSISRPPMLDGSNYPYWKARMRAFIKSIDEKAWRSIVFGWSPPTETDSDGKTSLKPEAKWTAAEDGLSNFNSKALNAIFTAVSPSQFKLISSCETAKDAWSILETAHEGTSAVRMSKLELLVGRFEKLRMKEEETIADFNGRVCDIANESFMLGEKIPEQRLIRKVLRSLPKRFEMKAAAIAEAKDLTTMKLEELMGSLRTYEMSFDDSQSGDEIKSVGLKAEVSKDESSESTDLEESLALLTKNFNRFMKKLNGRKKEVFQQRRSQYVPEKGKSSAQFESKGKGIQCRECEGFGHIQSECANTLKKKKVPAYNVTLSDDEESDDDGDSFVSNYVAFSGRFEGHEGTSQDMGEVTQDQ